MPDGQRLFPLVNKDDGWEVQKGVWNAASGIDLYVWVDPRKRTWQAFQRAGAKRLRPVGCRWGVMQPTTMYAHTRQSGERSGGFRDGPPHRN
jgi:hypothetical protein